MTTNTSSVPVGIIRKSAARLAAVQAIYSYDFGAEAKGAEKLALELVSLYAPEQSGDEEDSRAGVELDVKHLRILVTGVLEHRETLDGLIQQHLKETWSLERIGAVLRAILRNGLYELLHTSTPPKVVINEYIEVTRAFLGEEDVKFVNGVLDAVAKTR
jgi:N utilization substance protein B